MKQRPYLRIVLISSTGGLALVVSNNYFVYILISRAIILYIFQYLGQLFRVYFNIWDNYFVYFLISYFNI